MDRPGKQPKVQLFLLAVIAVSVVLVADHGRRAYQRLAYAFDLNFWSEDFFVTGMMKLRVGVPLYGPVSEANSSVYAPGQTLLHYALLAPLGAELSLSANKVLGYIFVVVAAVLGALVGLRLISAPGRLRVLLGAALGLALGLVLMANPVVDGLHPSNLEACVLAAATLACCALPTLTIWRRRALLLLLPVAALLVKQNGGVVVLVSLGLAAGFSTSLPGRVRRLDLLTLLLGAASAGLLLHLLGGKHFWDWGVTLLRAHAIEWHRVWRLTDGIGMWFVPVTLVALARLGWALVRHAPADVVWLRTATPCLLYAPLAVAAAVKTRGGSNNLASLGFALALVAIPALLSLVVAAKTRWAPVVAAGVLLLQLVTWRSHRYVPNGEDLDLAETVCNYAAKRMQCGERVWLGRGAICYARGGAAAATDRMTSVRDVVAAGRFTELALLERLQRAEYDVVMLHEADMRFLGPKFWPRLKEKYRLFHAGAEQAEGDYWRHGFQGWGSRRMLYFERRSDAGKHTSDASYGCGLAAR